MRLMMSLDAPVEIVAIALNSRRPKNTYQDYIEEVARWDIALLET